MSTWLEAIARWDTRTSLALQARRSRLPNLIFSALSWSGAAGVWFGLAIVLVLCSRSRIELIPRQWQFASSMLAAFGSVLIGGVIKGMAGRRRPFATDQGIVAAIWAPGPSRSFPSTHAATSVALAVALIVIAHPLAPIVALWAIGVSLSRVWLGVHYPSDVISGAVLGVAFGLLPWSRLLHEL